MKNKKLTLCKEINPRSRPCNVDLRTGVYKVSEIPLGSLTYKTDRVMCNGEAFFDPTGKKHPHSVVRAMYHISYMVRSEFIRSEHIPMVYDDMSCSIGEYERRVSCFNPMSGINHHIIRDDGDGDACPLIPTRKRLVKGQILKTKNNTAFISHSDKIFLEIRNQEGKCDCDDTYSTNPEDIFMRMINEFCPPLSTIAIPQPTTMNLEVHENLKVRPLSLLK